MTKFELKVYGLVIATFVLGFIGVTTFKGKSYVLHPKTGKEYSQVTAMITRMDGKSGGTGVILESKNNQSLVLTNAHVCGVIKNGGVVSTDNKEGTVTSYQVSEMHDLCLIKTNVNFHVSTEVSKYEPELYSTATVSGHPHLLPTIITTGNFSQKRIVTINYGFRPCTEQEKSDQELGVLCLFFGGLPEFRTYQAQVVGATIQPGSSGSAVFNSDGEIAGLVFAGSGDLAYGMIVPQEYVSYFVNQEIGFLTEQKPNNEISLLEEAKSKEAKDKCKETNNFTNNAIKKVCNDIMDDLVI